MKLKQMPCGVCGKNRQGLFCGLKGNIRSALNDEKVVHQFEPGQIIFYEGHPAFAIYCIHDGKVKLYKTIEKGERQVIRLLSEGDIVGFRAILANEPYAATAEAIDKTTACVISREMLHTLLQQSHELALAMMEKLAVELRVSEEQLLSLLHHPVRQRAANLLLSLIDKKTDSQAKSKVLLLKRFEMAQIIGTAPETLSRVLRDFANQKLIRLHRTEIIILNKTKLKKIAKL